MSDTLVRLLAMLQRVPRFPRKIDTVTLQGQLAAAGFAISLRSIQRDLNKLSATLPLVADEAKPQGWSWQADAPQLGLPALDPQSALVFHLVERHLRPLLPASTLHYIDPWLRTATAVLDEQGQGLARWKDKVRVLAPGQPMQPPQVSPEAQAVIYDALLQEKRVQVGYKPRGASRAKQYGVNPLGLVVRDRLICLVCTLNGYDDIKQLVLHRVRGAQLLDEPLRRPKGFDLDAYIAQGAFGWPQEHGKQIELVADFSRDAGLGLCERPLAANQRIEELEGERLRLRASVPDTRELRWWLMGFGAEVEVREPVALRREMAGVAGILCERYAETT